jgi:DNA-binding transcriptional MerR regulator
MITRGKVAKRLGVSIAAVRAFEGERLHPQMRHGRWEFEEPEVEELARLRAQGRGRLRTPFAELNRTRDNCPLCTKQPETSIEQRLVALEQTVVELHSRLEALEAESLAILFAQLRSQAEMLSPSERRVIAQHHPELLAIFAS